MSNRNNSSTSLRFYGGVPATEENYQEKVLSALRLPGPWQRATHRTRGGDLEIRERADGRFDLRSVGKEPLGWPMPDQVAERGVDAAYVRAEIVVLP